MMQTINYNYQLHLQIINYIEGVQIINYIEGAISKISEAIGRF